MVKSLLKMTMEIDKMSIRQHGGGPRVLGRCTCRCNHWHTLCWSPSHKVITTTGVTTSFFISPFLEKVQHILWH